ncbi:hypothetical protein DASC09_060580 [Saccharomycopsis crataegensis]|uniref:Ribosomal protein/NADH dehydrogenase domain-containing protein n=1 Tax=Saccharomycopsis crataegensis TaxID=43959 RepID=A0AAV5QV82_9ASCO|nr:hypothetical protein DASC09_060580 [Saccharomycopsis crataegensis]
MIGSKVLRFSVPTAVRELRFHLSQTGEASVPLRNYLSEQYPTIKKSNPELPILIREAFGVPPTLYARFEHGREAKYSLEGLSSSAIEQTLKNLK